MYLKVVRHFLLALLGAELLGAMLYFAVGDHFVFYFSRQYEPIGLVAIIFLLPALALALATLPQKSGRSNGRESAGAMTGVLLIAIGMLFYAPIGWASLVTWVFGQQRNHLTAELKEVGAYRGPWVKGCDQKGTIELPSMDASICLEDVGKTPMTNGAVFVDGRESSLGFFVLRVEK